MVRSEEVRVKAGVSRGAEGSREGAVGMLDPVVRALFARSSSRFPESGAFSGISRLRGFGAGVDEEDAGGCAVASGSAENGF